MVICNEFSADIGNISHSVNQRQVGDKLELFAGRANLNNGMMSIVLATS